MLSLLRVQDDVDFSAYTRDSLAAMLRLMGAKPRHSVKVAARVFDALELLARREGGSPGGSWRALPPRFPRSVRSVQLDASTSAVLLLRAQLEARVLWALAEYQYAKADQCVDLRLASR